MESGFKKDVASGVMNIVSAGLSIVYLTLSVIFTAFTGKTLNLVMVAIAWGFIMNYLIMASISSFSGSYKAANVLLKIENGFYSAANVLVTASVSLMFLPSAFGWTLAGIVLGIGTAWIVLGAFTGMEKNIFFQTGFIVTDLIGVYAVVMHKGYINYLFVLSMVIFIFARILMIITTKRWKRFPAVFIYSLGIGWYFAAIIYGCTING